MARGIASARRERDLRDEDAIDSTDVPATVVCAFCGHGDCPGCITEETTHASGVVAIVPWERPGLGLWSRLFTTAQATTRGAEAFFGALPDGDVGTAARFALTSEVVAVASVAAMIVPLVVLGFPKLLRSFLFDASTRLAIEATTLVGIVGFSLLLVASHAIYGLALAGGAAREGAKAQPSRGLRFGLYTCGWDLCQSPAGATAAALGEGIVAALLLFASALTAPSRSATAALSGMFHVHGKAAQRARGHALAMAMLFAVPACVVVLAAMGGAALVAFGV